MTIYKKDFSTLKSSVSTRLGDASNKTWAVALIADFINEEYSELLGLMQSYADFLTASKDIAVSAGTQEYDLPEDFDLARKVIRLDDKTELMKCDYDDFYQQAVDNQNGYTQGYYIRGAYQVAGAEPTTTYAQIGLVPGSDRAFSLRVIYQSKGETLSDATDLPLIPVQFEDLIVLGAMLRAFEQKAMTDMIKVYANRYAYKLQQFKKWLAYNRSKFSYGQLANFYNGAEN
jgi:hypothetical protein